MNAMQRSIKADSGNIIGPLISFSSSNVMSQLGSSNDKDEEGYDLPVLPDSIVDEILIRLPAKSIYRFKCVCKRWYLLISSRSFVRSYCLRFDRSVSIGPWTLLYRYTCGPQFYHIPRERSLGHVYSPEYVSPGFSVLLVPYSGKQLKIIAESSGLLLCLSMSSSVYSVCNPITNRWTALPLMSADLSRSYNDAMSGFGKGLITRVENGNCTSYTVVFPARLRRNALNMMLELDVVIFHSETGEWTCSKAFCSAASYPFVNPSAFFSSTRLRLVVPFTFNGFLHWCHYGNGIVLAFDLYGDEDTCLHFIKLPIAHSGWKYYRLCGVSCGRLQYYEASTADGTYNLSVWELKDGSREEWSMKHSYLWSQAWSHDEYLSGKLSSITILQDLVFEAVAFHPFDADVIYFHDMKRIISLNFRSRKLDLVCEPSRELLGLTWWEMMMPFVLPNWPTTLPRTVLTRKL